uniref:Uncharacterized protein n=1 Tax=viral metagenome TaxID=1070528 RepID=A0A6M3J9Z8_9ZZZZ
MTITEDELTVLETVEEMATVHDLEDLALDLMEQVEEHGHFICPQCFNRLEVDIYVCECGWRNILLDYM